MVNKNIETEARHGNLKSRSKKLRYVKTPGAKTVVRYHSGKTKKGRCAECGTIFKGVPNKTQGESSKLSKSSRRPERPYGGKLCSGCMRRKIIQGARR